MKSQGNDVTLERLTFLEAGLKEQCKHKGDEEQDEQPGEIKRAAEMRGEMRW